MRVANIARGEPYDVYCGRSPSGGVPLTPGARGWLGNPVKRGEPCPFCEEEHLAPGSTLPCFEAYLRVRLRHDEPFRAAFERIPADAALGCFCAPGPCHANVIVTLHEEITCAAND